MTPAPETCLTTAEASEVAAWLASHGDLESIEAAFLCDGSTFVAIANAISRVRKELLSAWRERAHVVIRGIPNDDEGASGLIVAMCAFSAPKRYGQGRIVKQFRMSPWTTALSHTLADGSFHTDINTIDLPPAATLIQCLEPDPGSPAYGQLRVVRSKDLCSALERKSEKRALQFLEHDQVTMLNERSPTGWSGRILSDDVIRFHPESLRAAQKRFGSNPSDLEDCLEVIHRTALKISMPIVLDRGDLLIVSNRRALHHRGACTVSFGQFPRDFITRRVAVFHTLDEPA